MLIKNPVKFFTELNIIDAYEVLLESLSSHGLTLTDFSLHKDLNEEYSLYLEMDAHWVEDIDYCLYILEWKFKEKTGKELELKYKVGTDCQVHPYWIAVNVY